MTLYRYLSRTVFTRFLAVLLALSALTELMDLLGSIDRLLGARTSLLNVLTYSALRLPLAVEQLFLLAVLIGSVLAFRTLARNNEIDMLRAAGLSPYLLLANLLPLGALLGITYFSLANHVAPAAERVFVEWWDGISPDTETAQDGPKDLLWLRAGQEIVSIARVENEGRRLEGVTRYRLGDDRLLIQRIRATSADLEGTVWHLHEVETVSLNEDMVEQKPRRELTWEEGPSAENIREITLPTERLSNRKSRKVLAGQWAGVAGADHYRTLIQKNLCALALPFLMILLATPAISGGRRLGGMAGGAATGFAMGLSFLACNGILTAITENGTMPVFLGVWAMPAIFSAFGTALLLYNEK